MKWLAGFILAKGQDLLRLKVVLLNADASRDVVLKVLISRRKVERVEESDSNPNDSRGPNGETCYGTQR